MLKAFGAVPARSMSTQMPSAAPEFFSHQVGEARRFYLGLHAPGKQPLTVVSAGLEHCASDYIIQRAKFPYSCIEYVVRGRGQLTLPSLTWPLKAGMAFSYGPGVPHQITSDSRDPLVKYFVDFTGRRAAPVLEKCGLTGGRVVEVFPPDSIMPLFEELIHTGMHLKANSNELCFKLLECLSLKIEATRTAPKTLQSPSFAAYLRCRTLIEKNFLYLRSLEQIAKRCGMDGAYICRLFRRFDHQSPYRYLLRLKINHAATELQKPGVLVKDVAIAVGFTDSFHFSRVFRTMLGAAPSQFRKLH
ncbi:MAG: helix-turn-helix domain-containing protein [Alphaproteobacteria bacterium]|nr:AraC family transcriptional regulator [Alphaproteobacteria bacterium]MDE2110082.1 helix-turn-helix domain-containing protein [Alphaproteobacteria bacterium]MDE2495108.1 helix-turn-helix domain-containing protein [Alphaproteobacteria bacterium]